MNVSLHPNSNGGGYKFRILGKHWVQTTQVRHGRDQDPLQTDL
jgi:hypothetical protein